MPAFEADNDGRAEPIARPSRDSVDSRESGSFKDKEDASGKGVVTDDPSHIIRRSSTGLNRQLSFKQPEAKRSAPTVFGSFMQAMKRFSAALNVTKLFKSKAAAPASKPHLGSVSFDGSHPSASRAESLERSRSLSRTLSMRDRSNSLQLD